MMTIAKRSSVVKRSLNIRGPSENARLAIFARAILLLCTPSTPLWSRNIGSCFDLILKEPLSWNS